MCGICGIVATNDAGMVSKEILERMNQSIRHRGPDEDGFFLAAKVGLVSRRLSIIVLKVENSPARMKMAQCGLFSMGKFTITVN